MSETSKTRFTPSPTGLPDVGSIYTALPDSLLQSLGLSLDEAAERGGLSARDEQWRRAAVYGRCGGFWMYSVSAASELAYTPQRRC
jgi:hypothetical protein